MHLLTDDDDSEGAWDDLQFTGLRVFGAQLRGGQLDPSGDRVEDRGARADMGFDRFDQMRCAIEADHRQLTIKARNVAEPGLGIVKGRVGMDTHRHGGHLGARIGTGNARNTVLTGRQDKAPLRYEGDARRLPCPPRAT